MIPDDYNDRIYDDEQNNESSNIDRNTRFDDDDSQQVQQPKQKKRTISTRNIQTTEEIRDIIVEETIQKEPTYAVYEKSKSATTRNPHPVMIASGKAFIDKYATNKWDEVIEKSDKCESGRTYEVLRYKKGDLTGEVVYQMVCPTFRYEDDKIIERPSNPYYMQQTGLNDSALADLLDKEQERYRNDIEMIRNELQQARENERAMRDRYMDVQKENERIKAEIELERKLKEIEERQAIEFEKQLDKIQANKSGLGDMGQMVMQNVLSNPVVGNVIGGILGAVASKFIDIPKETSQTQQAQQQPQPMQATTMSQEQLEQLIKQQNGIQV